MRNYEEDFKVHEVEEALVGVAHIAVSLGSGYEAYSYCGVLFDTRTEAVATARPGVPVCGLCEDCRRRERGE